MPITKLRPHKEWPLFKTPLLSSLVTSIPQANLAGPSLELQREGFQLGTQPLPPQT